MKLRAFSRISTRDVALGGVVAALYALLTYLFAPLSYGDVQVRFAEALTLLPIFTPAAIPGLFVGCFVANLLGGVSALDMIFGPLATLVAALLTRLLRARPALAALPPVLVNAAVIGWVLSMATRIPFRLTFCSVAFGQAIACYLLGLPLAALLKRIPAGPRNPFGPDC